MRTEMSFPNEGVGRPSLLSGSTGLADEWGRPNLFSRSIRVFFLVILAVATGLGALPTSVAPGKPEQTSFQEALRAAEDNLRSMAGIEYEMAFHKNLTLWLSMKRDQLTTGMASGRRTILARINLSGEVEELSVWPDSETLRDVLKDFPPTGHPRPPGPSWWVKVSEIVNVTYSREDRAPAIAKTEEPNLKVPEGGGIVYGDTLGALVRAPDGWILDMESGVSQGAPAVMYPRGSSWQNGDEVIYVRPGTLDEGETLESAISKDIADFKARAPALRVEDLGTVRLVSGEVAQLRKFSGDPFGNQEGVAYVSQGAGLIIYVLSCRDSSKFESGLGLFRDVVARSFLVGMKFPDLEEGRLGEEAYGFPDPFVYWSGFGPGTFVTFRYRSTTAGISSESLKTFTLENVGPEFVALEYRESALEIPGQPSPEVSRAPTFKTKIGFGKSDSGLSDVDLLGSQLGFSISGILKNSGSENLIGKSTEEMDWKGKKIVTSRIRVGFRGAEALTSITLWFSDEIPGKLFKAVRELKGRVALREELFLEDYRIVGPGKSLGIFL